MTETPPPEPSMEEILASIRRIISEDEGADGHNADGGRAGDEREAEVLVLTDRAPPETDVLVLTDRIPPDAPSPHDSAHDTPPPESTSPRQTVLSSSPEVAQTMTSPTPPADPDPAPEQATAAAHPNGVAEAAKAFEDLHVAVESADAKQTPAVSSGPTLEDLARDLLRPMIAAWLDDNLADIVRVRVDAEIERIARGRVR
jgi:cell pole-organizing protein PopZ